MMKERWTVESEIDSSGRTLEEFLKQYDPGNFPRPSLTADICVFSEKGLLLIVRRNHPFIHHWALPGGFADKNETLEDTAKRELEEETSIRADNMQLVGVYSRYGRDPRGWTVTAAYMKNVRLQDITVAAGDDAGDARWFRVSEINGRLHLECDDFYIEEEDLAFDHNEVIRDACKMQGILK